MKRIVDIDKNDMIKLKIFVALALLAVAMPLSAQRQYAEGDIVQDPKFPNIKREMIEDVSQKWLVHITGKLPVTATLNGHDYVDLGIKVEGKLIMWAACDVGATKPEQVGTTYGWAEVEHKAELDGSNSASYGKKVYRSTVLGTRNTTPRASIGAVSGDCRLCRSSICLSANASGNRRR